MRTTLLVTLIAAFISVAYAQGHTCTPFDSTGYTATVCPVPTHTIDNTNVALAVDANNALKTLKSFQNSTGFISETCISLYLQLICAEVFPTCNSSVDATVPFGACASVCRSIYFPGPNNCTAAIEAINSVATIAKIPQNSFGCDSQYPSPQDACTNADDVLFDTTGVEQSCTTVVDTTSEVWYNESVFIPLSLYQNASYFADILLDYKLQLRYLLGAPNPAGGGGHESVNKSCLEAYILYFNALTVPECPNDPPADYVAPKPCSSLCVDIITECAAYGLDIIKNEMGVIVPSFSPAGCHPPANPNFAELPNCYLPTLADLGGGIAYYNLADDGTSTPSPSGPPTLGPYSSSETDYAYSDGPQEEWAKGGILGGGLLVAIFAVVGGLMLLMKRQDSR